MEWNIFDKWIDTLLYLQMKDLIYMVCSKEDKYTLKRENEKFELFSGALENTMEEEYGLHYPGEVLERLGEHKEITVKQIRALGLALAKMKNLLEENMFIGKQLSVFLKKMKGLSDENDPFILGIRYLMDEKTKQQTYEKFIHYPFQEVDEMLFALSILPEDEGLWKVIRTKLNAKLGKDRKISVYENSRVYVWLAQNFQFRMKGYRKKDMDAFKYLIRLPFCNASGSGKVVRKKLLENGYCDEEISFLNYVMIQEVYLHGSVRESSITAEKLAVEVCRTFLNAEKEYPQQAYDLCSQLCAFYQTFSIKINGHGGIAEALGSRVRIKNVKAFLVLHPYTDKEYLRGWKRFDITDSKWDDLYLRLLPEKYDACVEESLRAENDAEKLEKSLERYKKLTGNDYTERFWDLEDCGSRLVFNHLAEYGVLPVIKLMEQFLDEYQENETLAKEKWKHMAWYMRPYMEDITTYEAYAMLERLVEKVGITNSAELFSVMELLDTCFSRDPDSSYWNPKKKLDIFRPFLEVEEHRKLFSWIEEYIFRDHTEDYVKFLVHVLSKEDNLIWFPKEDAKAIFLYLEGDMKISKKETLREIYLTESEQEKRIKEEKELEDRKALKKKLDERKKLKHSFTEVIAKSRLQAGQFQKINSFIMKQSRTMEEDAKEMAASYARAFLTREKVCLYTDTDMGELFQFLSTLYEAGALDLETVKKFIDEMEAVQNETADTETYKDC